MNTQSIATQTNGTQDKSIVTLLERIDRRLARLEESVARVDSLAQGAPGAIGTLVDTLDGLAARLGADGIDVDQRARAMVRLVERLTAPQTTAALETLLDSGLFDARTLDSLGRVTDALAVTGQSAPPAPVGAWGAFRALGDPDVQRSVGLLLAIAKELGRSLAGPPAEKQLPASSQAR